jgi:hypothetical protein
MFLGSKALQESHNWLPALLTGVSILSWSLHFQSGGHHTLPSTSLHWTTWRRVCLVIEVEVTLRPTVSRPVSVDVRRPSGTRDQFYFRLEIFFRQLRVCNFVAPCLTRGRVCNLLYNCFWALPEQSFLGRSPAELRPYFTVSSENPPTWRARSR